MKKQKEHVTKTESKGLIYESFVKLALDQVSSRCKFSLIDWHPKLEGVLSEQDFAIWKDDLLFLVIGVTYWGSHEAAKMKFWRIHEDIFEVHESFEKANFLHILFEKNANSDDNLVDLINLMCSGLSISDSECSSIKVLQSYVASDTKIKRFGSGQNTIIAKCHELQATDETFKNAILGLSTSIYDDIKNKSTDNIRSISKKQNCLMQSFNCSGSRKTFYKPALISLMRLGFSKTEKLFNIYENKGKTGICNKDILKHNNLIKSLEELNLINTKSLVYKINPDLDQLFKIGKKQCLNYLSIIESKLKDKNSTLYSYYEHYRDVTQDEICSERLEKLCSVGSWEELRNLMLYKGDERIRCWPLDYFLAIEREHVKGKKYGLQKLSIEANINYVAGGISPLPKFAKGDFNAISKIELENLCHVIIDKMSRWQLTNKTIEVVQYDRNITLRKKLDVLEIIVLNSLEKIKTPQLSLKQNLPVKHIYADNIKNKRAGSTQFNFYIGNQQKGIALFIVSSYDSTHKHKEVAGRVRMAKLRMAKSTDIFPEKTGFILLVDGSFLKDNYTKRTQMLKDAGCTSAYYFDELDTLNKDISFYFDLSN